jgi:alkylation response protein AidB-like acyl-CoA dehydrogenase
MKTGFSQALLDRVGSFETRIDADRSLPAELVAALHEEQAFRLLIPQAAGGAELPFPDYIRWIRELAMRDASTAWCVNQSAVIGTTTLWLQADVVKRIWTDPRQSVANGPPLTATLEVRPEGGLVTADWGFSSGCRHARLMSGAVRRTSDQLWRVVFFPPEQARFIDDWDVAGLRGTASFRFSVRDLVVAPEMIADLGGEPAFDVPFTRLATGLAFAVSFASLALGVARRGLDCAIDLCSGKKPIYAREALKNDGTVQHRLGELEARWRGARAWLDDVVATVWEEIRHQSRMTESQRIAWRLCGTHVIRESVAVMQGCYQICGSSGIYRTHELHRPWADLQVISQHVQAREQYYAMIGRWLLGHPYEYGPLA